MRVYCKLRFVCNLIRLAFPRRMISLVGLALSVGLVAPSPVSAQTATPPTPETLPRDPLTPISISPDASRREARILNAENLRRATLKDKEAARRNARYRINRLALGIVQSKLFHLKRVNTAIELGLNEAQRREINMLAAILSDSLRRLNETESAMIDLPGPLDARRIDQGERDRRALANQADMLAIEGILYPNQVEYLNRQYWRIDGLFALDRAEAADSLGLGARQRRAIREQILGIERLRAFRPEVPYIEGEPDPVALQQAETERGQLIAQAEGSAWTILTPAQAAHWERLVSSPSSPLPKLEEPDAAPHAAEARQIRDRPTSPLFEQLADEATAGRLGLKPGQRKSVADLDEVGRAARARVTRRMEPDKAERARRSITDHAEAIARGGCLDHDQVRLLNEKAPPEK